MKKVFVSFGAIALIIVAFLLPELVYRQVIRTYEEKTAYETLNSEMAFGDESTQETLRKIDAIGYAFQNPDKITLDALDFQEDRSGYLQLQYRLQNDMEQWLMLEYLGNEMIDDLLSENLLKSGIREVGDHEKTSYRLRSKQDIIYDVFTFEPAKSESRGITLRVYADRESRKIYMMSVSGKKLGRIMKKWSKKTDNHLLSYNAENLGTIKKYLGSYYGLGENLKYYGFRNKVIFALDNGAKWQVKISRKKSEIVIGFCGFENNFKK